MKFQILKNLESHLIKLRVPTEYKSLAMALESQLGKYSTLIIFPHNRKDIVKSSLVVKALERLEQPHALSLVVVGGCFTSESVQLLNLRKAYFLSLSEFNWTDASSIGIQGTQKG